MRPYRHKVNYYETDKMQFTHHSNYIRFMEEARLDFMEQMGWGYDKMEEEGIASPVLRVECDYKKSTTFPDVIEIEVSVLDMSRTRLKIGYEMTVDGQTVCIASSEHCFMNRQGRPVNISRSYPEIYARLEAMRKQREAGENPR